MTLTELRAFLADQIQHMKFDLARSTQVDYQRIMNAVDDDLIAFLRSAPNSTFGKRKCAILWRLRFLLRETINDIDDGLRLGQVDQSSRLRQANAFAELIATVAAEQRAKSRTQAGKSKRVGLKRLSKKGDFRSRLAAAAGKAGRIAILVLAIAGVRPLELQKGVLLKQTGEHEYDVVIAGVKHTDDTGHEFRIQTHDARIGELGAQLLAAIRKAGGKLRVQRKADALRDDIKAAARRAKMPHSISPYSLRHQFSSDLKAAGWSDVDRAKAMGHASTRTGGRYGRKKSGSTGGSSMVKVWASGLVREPVRTLPGVSGRAVETEIVLTSNPSSLATPSDELNAGWKH